MGNHIRPATEADLPALKDIVLSGLVNDSIWHYCFPNPTSSEAGDYVESILKKCLDPQNSNWLISVVDAPKTHKPVAVAVWQELHENDSEENNVHNQVHRGKLTEKPPLAVSASDLSSSPRCPQHRK